MLRPTRPPTYLRTAQVAELLGTSPKTISRWAKEGKLPYLRTLGGHRRFEEAYIRKLAEELYEDSTLERLAATNGRQADRDLASGRTVPLDEVIR